MIGNVPIDFATIQEIGNEMVHCNQVCNGILRDQPNGHLPRCLILETEGRNLNETGIIVCGLNPAAIGDEEQAFYAEGVLGYQLLQDYWDEELRSHPYYERLRPVIASLGITGEILWTDTVKCEKHPDEKVFNHRQFPATLRACCRSFLSLELEACPEDYPVLAVGREAFSALTLLCLDRFVLGVPHCTGNFAANTFRQLLQHETFENGFTPGIVARVEAARDADPNGCLWVAEG